MAEGHLDEARTISDVAADHVSDHNDIHQWINAQRNSEAAFHADSDYFSDEDITAYTELDITGTTTWAEKYGKLSCKHLSIASGDRGILGKAMTPTVAPVTLECEITIFFAHGNVVVQGGGIGFTDGVTATDSFVGLEVFGDTGGVTIQMTSGTLTVATTDEGNISLKPTDGNDAITGPIHLRLTWDAANTWSAYWSTDRVSWIAVAEAVSFTLTPDTTVFSVLDTADGSEAITTWRNFEVSEADPGSGA